MQDTESNVSDKRRPKVKKQLFVWAVIVVVIAGSIAAALYYKGEAEKVKSDPSAAQSEQNQAETDRVLTALKKVLFIGEQDAPTVARVEDPEKLKSSNPDFYKDIQAGDYLVIYPKRAIVFRENISQIINIAPIINTSELKAGQGTTPASEEVPAN